MNGSAATLLCRSGVRASSVSSTPVKRPSLSFHMHTRAASGKAWLRTSKTFSEPPLGCSHSCTRTPLTAVLPAEPERHRMLRRTPRHPIAIFSTRP